MKKLLIISFISLFAFSEVHSQSAAIGPQLGYYKSQDADQGNVMIGAALRLKLSDSFGVEGSINYRKEDYDNGNLKVISYPVMVSALVYVIPIVYGAAGAGWYNTKYDYSTTYESSGLKDETKQEFGYHLGAGVEIPVGNILVTGDVRYVFLDLKLDKLPSAKSLKSNFYVITGGILFRL